TRASRILLECPNLVSLELADLHLDCLPKRLRSLTLVRCQVDDRAWECLESGLVFLSIDGPVPSRVLEQHETTLSGIKTRIAQDVGELESMQRVRNLTHLDVEASQGVRVEQLSWLPLIAPNLSHLGIGSLPIYQRQADALANVLGELNHLCSLDIRNTPGAFHSLLLLDDINPAVPANLHSLQLGSDVYLTDGPCRRLFSMLSSLTHLEFQSDSPLSSQVLQTVLSRTKGLKTLILPTQSASPSLQLLSTPALLKIPTLLPNLCHFQVHGALITHDVIYAFSNHAKNMQVLDLAFCRNKAPLVDGDAILHLLSQLTQLVHLNLKAVFSPIPPTLRAIKATHARTIITL
ncbi:hypothetical protein HDU91_001766, partial [Kappamyces sp. JEL0680]